MSDEQTTSGTTVNPAATAQAPRQGGPVMDVLPPPSASGAAVESAVVEAPPEMQDVLQISDDIAEQIAADATTSPLPERSQVANPPANAAGEVAVPPQDTEPVAADSGDSPSELIQAEITRNEALPIAAVNAPKVANPVRTAVIATVFITIMLAGLAVFAYMSSQN